MSKSQLSILDEIIIDNSVGLTLGSLFDGIGGFPLCATICGIKPRNSLAIPCALRVVGGIADYIMSELNEAMAV